MDQPGKVTNPARGQLRKMKISLSLFAPESLVSRDGFGMSRASLLDHGIPPDFRGGAHLYILTAIRHRSLVYRVAYRWRSLPRVTSTGPEVPKVLVPVTRAAFRKVCRSPMNQLMCAFLFPHPLTLTRYCKE